MPQAISDIIKRAAVRCSLEEPTGTLYSSTDKDIKLLLEMAIATGEELRDECFFPELKKTHTITTTTASQYALPGDFYRMISGTHWDQSNSWAMSGPLSDAEWNLWKYGVISGTTKKRYRVFGSNFNTGQFFVDPAPSSGEIISFEYSRRPWFMPKVWTSGEAVVDSITYRFSNGNLYLALTTAACGGTAPSHLSGGASDGAVTWQYVATQTYSTTERFLADTDILLVDDDLILMGTVWRFKEEKGFEYAEKKDQYLRAKEKRKFKLPGASIISLASSGYTTLSTADNIPEGDYGY